MEDQTSPASDSFELDASARRVFITERGSVNYDKAKTYGRLLALTTTTDRVRTLSDLEQLIHDGLEDFQAHDFLLISGSPLTALIAYVTVQRKHTHPNILYYDEVLRDFFPAKL